MSQNILVIIEMILQKKTDDTKKIMEVVSFFRRYRNGMYIYPGVLKRKFGFDIQTSYLILEELKKQDILKSYYELHHCGKVAGYVEVFNMLPETFECDVCGEEISALENSSLIYQVVKDE